MSVILEPFILAFFLAYISKPLVSHLANRRVFKKYILPRSFWAGLILMTMITGLLLLILILSPLIQEQITLLIAKMPDIVATLESHIKPWLKTHFGFTGDFKNNAPLKSVLMTHLPPAGQVVDTFFLTLRHSTVAIAHFLLSIVLAFVIAFYLLRDWPQWTANILESMPVRYKAKVRRFFHQCDEVLSAFFRGQCLVMLVLTFFYTTGFMILGFNFALLMGIGLGIFSIVPYAGAILGFLMAVIAALFQFGTLKSVLHVLILFIIGHLIENTVLTPWLVGHRVGLHPVLVILAILAGGSFGGFWGVLLAVPVTAVLMVLLKNMFYFYKQTPFYKA